MLARKLNFSARELRLVWPLLEAADMIADAPANLGGNDTRLVAAANAAGASIFITGDRRILAWTPPGGLRFLAPRAAWIELLAPHLRSA